MQTVCKPYRFTSLFNVLYLGATTTTTMLEPADFPPHLRITKVGNCARCGQDHDELVAHKFARPCGNFNYWSICPTNGDPMLIEVTEKEQQQPETTNKSNHGD